MLSVADILAEIENRAGIADSELVFRPNLEHFVAALNSDNRLSALGAASVRQSLVHRAAMQTLGVNRGITRRKS
jgi:hypothetical protein